MIVHTANDQNPQGPVTERLKILVLPEGYPSEEHPGRGFFVKELVRALSSLDEVRVLYPTLRPDPDSPRRITFTKNIEDGIPTWRAEYGWVPGLLHRSINNRLTSERSAGDEALEVEEDQIESTSLSLKSFVSKAVREARYVAYCAFVVFSLVRVIRSGWRPDIIHAVTYGPGLPAIIVGRLFRIPVVIAEYSSMIGMHTISPMMRRKLRFSHRRADAVLPCSVFLQSAISRYVVCKRSEVVPYPVDTSCFRPSSAVADREDGLKHIVAVSNLVPRKGIHYLLLSLALVAEDRRDFRVEIIGDGPMREGYETSSKELGIEDLVIFSGIMAQHEDVADRMMGCDFFVHPSTYESLGVVIIEAIACGKPLVFTELGPYREIVDGDIVGIGVTPGAVDQLAGAIEYMLDHFRDYDPEAIAANSSLRFSHEVIAGRLHDIYQSIVARDTNA